MQLFQKTGGMGAVHLGVMELDGNAQLVAQPVAMIAPPGEVGIVVDAAVLVDEAVELRSRDSRCADDVGLFVEDVLARGGALLRDGIVVAAELLQVVAIRDIAKADATFCVVDDDIQRQTVESVELLLGGQQVELIEGAGGTSDAPAKQHIELHVLAPADLPQSRHVDGLDNSHHRLWRFHPQLIGLRPTGFLGIYFLSHVPISIILLNVLCIIGYKGSNFLFNYPIFTNKNCENGLKL